MQQAETQTLATDRKYNCLALRLVIYWSAAGGVDYILWGSRSFTDAVLHEWDVISKQSPDRLKLSSL